MLYKAVCNNTAKLKASDRENKRQMTDRALF